MTSKRHRIRARNGLILWTLVLTIALVVPASVAGGETGDGASSNLTRAQTRIVIKIYDNPDIVSPIKDTVSLTIWNVNTNWAETVEVDDGRHEFNPDQPGAFIFSAEANGYLDIGQGHTSIIQVKRGDYESRTLILEKKEMAQEFSGFVYDKDNKGIGSVRLTLYGDYDYTKIVTSAANGSFSVKTWDSMFWVLAEKDGYQRQKFKIDLTSGDLMQNVTLMKESVFLRGEVSDAESEFGEEIENAQAYLFDIPAQDDEINGGWFIAGTPSWYYEIVAYDDPSIPSRSFALIIDAPGYNPYVEYEFDLDQNKSRNVALQPIEDETLSTTIDLTNWKNAKIVTEWVVNAESNIFGLRHEGYGSPLFQIDTDPAFGHADDKYNGRIDTSERNDFQIWLESKGPYYFDTFNIFEINNTYYNASVDDYDVTISGLNGTLVNSTDTFTIKTEYDLDTLEDLASGGSRYTISLDKLRTHETVTVTIPNGYEVPTSGLPDGVEREDVRVVKFTKTGTVTVGKSEAPEAVLKVSLSGDPPFITVGQNITLDASGSSDPNEPDNDDLNYSWDFDYTTSFTPDEYGMEVSHNWSEAGEYNVSLRVRDSGEKESFEYKIIRVDDASPIIGTISVTGAESLKTLGGDTWEINEAVASNDKFNATQEAGWIVFNASSVMDHVDAGKSAEGEVLPSGYKWYFRGNDQPQQVRTGIEVNFSWAVPGEYEVELNVSDVVGNRAVKIYTIHVLDITKPVPGFDVEGKLSEGRVPWETKLTFNASTSTDNINVTQYRWDFGDGQYTAWSTEPIYNYTFTSAILKAKKDAVGKLEFNVTVNTTDVRGNFQSKTKSILVVTPAFTIEIPKFSKEKAKEDEKVTINTTVNNTADVKAEGVRVVFLSDNKEIGSQTVDLEAKGGAEVGINWKAKGGSHLIKVYIDYEFGTTGTSGATTAEDKIEVKVEPTQYEIYIVIIIIVVVVGVFWFWRKKRREAFEARRKERKAEEGSKRRRR